MFLRLFANFYPCKECREDFQTSLREDPPEVGGRTPLMLWMCRAHNRVNERLGKPLFDCSVSGVEQRWKSGHPACDAEEHFEH